MTEDKKKDFAKYGIRIANTYEGLETSTELTRDFDCSFENFMPPMPLPSFTSADFIKGITETSFSISGLGFLPLDLIFGEVDDRRHLTIGEVELIVKVISFDEVPGQSEFRFEILDVLSPPEAREAWLEEKRKRL